MLDTRPIWLHLRPYGEVHLDIGQRLTIGA
jgi:hypothetical protein